MPWFDKHVNRRVPLGQFRPIVHASSGLIGFNPGGTPNYDVAPDGQRFAMVQPDTEGSFGDTDRQVIVVQNWFEELERLVPTGR